MNEAFQIGAFQSGAFQTGKTLGGSSHISKLIITEILRENASESSVEEQNSSGDVHGNLNPGGSIKS